VKKRKPPPCQRCKAPWKGSDEDEGRCSKCFAPRVEVKFPQDDEDM
jgi:hypothetical protein